MKRLLFSLGIFLLACFCFASLAQANLLYDPHIVSEGNPGNIPQQFPQDPKRLGAHMWNYADCEENCEKWLEQSQLTCTDKDDLRLVTQGDPSILQELAPFQLPGSGSVERDVGEISNFTNDACTDSKLLMNERMIAQDWARWNSRVAGEKGLSQACEGTTDPSTYTPNACANYGVNMGDYAYATSFATSITSGRPIVVLIDINASAIPDEVFFQANPLILRITGISNEMSEDDIQRAGSFFGSQLAGKNAILVFGNEVNNPELEKNGGVNYCAGIEIPSCGGRYVSHFRAFKTAIDGRVQVAAAPLDLINTQYPADNFFEEAKPAYDNADVLAANVYCPTNSDVQGCISGSDFGFAFYRQPDGKTRIITEYGPNPPSAPLIDQVKFIEDTCQTVGSQAALVNPLLVNSCSGVNGDWLYYVDGLVYDKAGHEVGLDCSVAGGPSDGSDEYDSFYDYWQGNHVDKEMLPEEQVSWAWDRCIGDIIPTQEEADSYCARNIHCTNPSQICVAEDDCRSNYEVCKDLKEVMGGGDKLPSKARVRAIWQGVSKKLKTEVGQITETKAGVRAFMLIVRDPSFKDICLGPLCYNREPRMEVLDMELPGIEGAYQAMREKDKMTKMPQDFQNDLSEFIEAGGSFPATCPTNCEAISFQQCQSLDQYLGEKDAFEEEYTQERIDFYKRLVQRVCAESLTCDGGAGTAVAQYTGSEVPAKTTSSFLESLQFFIQRINGQFVKPESFPTYRGFVVADEATMLYSNFSTAYMNQFLMPFELRDPKQGALYKNSFQGGAEAKTTTVSRTRAVPCNDPNDPNCIRTETESAFVDSENLSENKFNLNGANSTQEIHDREGVRNSWLHLHQVGDRFTGIGRSLADEISCKGLRMASILGITSAEGCTSPQTTDDDEAVSTSPNYQCVAAAADRLIGDIPGNPIPLNDGQLRFDIPDFTDSSASCNSQAISNFVTSPGRFPNSQIATYINQVIQGSKAAGVNPAFAIAVWIAESGASDYQDLCVRGNVLDFGFNSQEHAFKFDEQLRAFLQTFRDYRSGSAAYSCRVGSDEEMTFEDWAVMFSEGTCTGSRGEAVAAGQFTQNRNFASNVKRWYDAIRGFCN